MMIAVVGAGGKTTVCRKIAYELKNCRTLLTTTTKIYPPEDGDVYIGAVHAIPEDKIFVTAAKETIPNGKLRGYTPQELEQITGTFDYIVVEADGANKKPVKAPNDTEPVYPISTDLVIGVIGLDCLGSPIDDDHVHRAALFAEITQAKPGDIIASQHLIRLISHSHGLFRGAPLEAKKIVFLNKSDTLDETNKDTGKAILESITLPALVISREADWFTNFYVEYMKGCQ